jgi:hypothetical protein
MDVLMFVDLLCLHQSHKRGKVKTNKFSTEASQLAAKLEFNMPGFEALVNYLKRTPGR